MAFTPLGQKPQEKPQSLFGRFSETLGDFSEGFAKGGLQTLQNIGNVVAKPLNTGFNKLLGQNQKVGLPDKTFETENKAQEIGKTTERIAEFFVPASKIAKTEALITTLSQGMPKLAGIATRLGGKALVNAAADTAVGTAQTGDLQEGLRIGALGGGIRAGLGAVGEVARAVRLPERMYQTVFKNAKRDMMAEFNTDYLVDLYKNRPHVYKDLAEQGIIKMEDGSPILNTTIAEEALSRGLKGSITSMGKQVAGDLLNNEAQVRTLVKGYKGTVGLEQPQFFNVLREIAEEYRNVGFGEISDQADSLAKIWLDSKGKVDGETALAIRRLLDKARLARSFDVPVTKLSLSQANLKTLADEARKRLNKIPQLEPVMADYSFNIDALEDLAKEGARRGNNQLLSLIDSIFLGTGLAGGQIPQAVTLASIRKYIQSGRGATTVGSMVKNPNASAQTVGAIGAGASLLAGEGQQPPEQLGPQSPQSFIPYTPNQ